MAAVDGGLSRRKAAEQFGVSISSTIRWTSRARRLGSVRPEPQGGDKRSRRIEGACAGDPGRDRPGARHHACRIARAPGRARGGGGPLDAVARLRPAADHAQKSAHAAEQDLPDVLSRRRAWFESQIDLDPEHLVFIDEPGASTKMARLYGCALRGRRLRWRSCRRWSCRTPPASPCGARGPAACPGHSLRRSPA